MNNFPLAFSRISPIHKMGWLAKTRECPIGSGEYPSLSFKDMAANCKVPHYSRYPLISSYPI